MNLSSQHNILSLKNSTEIKDLLAHGRKVFNRYGIIFINEGTHYPDTRAAILIKKKVGNAVKRNYVKRIIRHFIREQGAMLLKYKRSTFLYLYQGTVCYNDLAAEYLKVLKKYETSTAADN